MWEDPAAQQVVALFGSILKTRSCALSPESTILDFGCGSGRHTYEYRDAGFHNAFGYDLRNFVELRSPADRGQFRFDPAPSDAAAYPSMTAVPWPDDTFDFVFATSVFEHVSDQDLAYREIYRVLKPGGAFLNIFPSRCRPLEAHTNIPFGGLFVAPRYLELCAALGIRGAGQEHLPADRVVEINRMFLAKGVNYLSGRQIADLVGRIFDQFEYVEDALIRHGRGRSRYLAVPLRFVPGLRQAYRFAHARAILSRKRQGAASRA